MTSTMTRERSLIDCNNFELINESDKLFLAILKSVLFLFASQDGPKFLPRRFHNDRYKNE